MGGGGALVTQYGGHKSLFLLILYNFKNNVGGGGGGGGHVASAPLLRGLCRSNITFSVTDLSSFPRGRDQTSSPKLPSRRKHTKKANVPLFMIAWVLILFRTTLQNLILTNSVFFVKRNVLS